MGELLSTEMRKYAKQEFGSERSELARQIWEKRIEYFRQKADTFARKQRLQDAIDIHEQDDVSFQDRAVDFQARVDFLSSQPFIYRLLHRAVLKNLRQQVTTLQHLSDQSKLDQEERLEELDMVISDYEHKYTSFRTSQEYQDGHELLSGYYSRVIGRWEKLGYTSTEVRETFSQEKMVGYSVDDIIFLLKRFHGGILTHVVKQGVRDHTSEGGNIQGKGSFFSGLDGILTSGRLKSPLGAAMCDGMTEEAVAKLLKIDEARSLEEALKGLERYVGYNARFSGRFGDGYLYSNIASLHAATDFVADDMYGAESGNVPFFIFPSDFIASNYLHIGPISQTSDTVNDRHNDVWIWGDNFDTGINMHTGILFLPADVNVDTATGSKYALDENRVPITQHEEVALLMNWVRERESHSHTDLPPKFDLFCKDPELLGCIDSKDYYDPLMYKIEAEDLIQRKLIQYGHMYKKPQSTTSSREYWESYFKNNPSRRPSKVVYYSGLPNEALQAWQEKNGIRHRNYSSVCESLVKDTSSSETQPDVETFKRIALAVISKRFGLEE